MEKSTFRQRIAKVIVFYGVLSFMLVVVLRISGGLLTDEFWKVLSFITPVSVVYIGLLSRFLVQPIAPSTSTSQQFSPTFVYGTQAVIHVHFGFLAFFLLAKGIFNWYSVEELRRIFPILETLYGGASGILISELFKEEETK
jgi:hypothetical protein